jgi:1,4-dihydroxy-2-naphthoyl-CoA hydrolase
MPIWTRSFTPEMINDNARDTAAHHLGIEITEVGDDYLKGRMPVDHRTVQPHRILHGGASVLLAETLGSVAANFCLKQQGTVAVGLDINANHLRPVASGWVYGTARPVHIGSTTQVWEIRITTGDDKPVCVSRLTMAVIATPGAVTSG